MSQDNPHNNLFDHIDFYQLNTLLTKEQKTLRQRVRDYIETVVMPNINPFWQKAEFPHDIAMKLRDVGVIGGMLQGYGASGLDAYELGLTSYELSKGDGSIATFWGVHSGLAMGSIGLLGDKEQKARWLPDMATLNKIGAFGLTEPNVGSNAAKVQTTVRKDGNSYIINGAKRWIGNASISDLLIIWARDEDSGEFGGYIIEDPQTTQGVTLNDIWGKISKRAVLNADIKLDNVRVPTSNKLAHASSFRDTSKVLKLGRYSVAWSAAGLASGALELAIRYTKSREQFGKPIASFQLIQQKLVEMATEVTLMQTLCWQMATLLEHDQLTDGMVSMAKYNNACKTREITRLARECLGGNGILIDQHIARLMLDTEALYTYEGTNEINLLLIGREITGMNAFV